MRVPCDCANTQILAHFDGLQLPLFDDSHQLGRSYRQQRQNQLLLVELDQFLD